MTDKPPTKRRSGLEPVFWSCFLYILGLVLTFLYIKPVEVYVVTSGIEVPEYSFLPVLGYFFGVVIAVGLILFFIPVSKLRLALKVLFSFFYIWGIFIILALVLPTAAAVGIAVIIAAVWFFFSYVWLQNLLLLVTLVSVGVVFGALVSPWTVLYLLLAISIYDIVAVTLGYMMWMARKLSEADTLPAFIMPKSLTQWRLNLKGSTVQKLFDEESSEREFSMLGGGDLGFPLVFVVSVFFAYGYSGAFIVAGASILGLIFAYLLQIYLLKGKPLPALPPISFLSILGFLIVHFLGPF
jgi:presenilin-like A22 family membrane protease